MQSMIYGLIPLAIVCYNVIIEVIAAISKSSDVSKIYGNKYQQLDDHKNYINKSKVLPYYLPIIFPSPKLSSPLTSLKPYSTGRSDICYISVLQHLCLQNLDCYQNIEINTRNVVQKLSDAPAFTTTTSRHLL